MEIDTARDSELSLRVNASDQVSNLQCGVDKDTDAGHTGHSFTGLQVLDVSDCLASICPLIANAVLAIHQLIPTLFFEANLLASWEPAAASFQADLLNSGLSGWANSACRGMLDS